MDRLAFNAAATINEMRMARQQLSHEMANMNTNGFKKSYEVALVAHKASGQGFDSRFQPLAVPTDLIMLKPGPLIATGRDLDVLLNGNTVTVDDKVGVIADDSQVESLAGIMGGDATAVSDDTQNIYIEAAFWWPKAIAGRSRRYNFSTDAGHRFERGVDPESTVEHIERITQLVIDVCGTPSTQIGPVDDQKLNMPIRKPVTLRVARAVKVIGMALSQKQCADALRGLDFEVTEADGLITVNPPSWRFDLEIEEDLIEEVARMVGYTQLPTTPPLAPITAKIRKENLRGPFAVRRSIAALGYQETINFSFVEAHWEHELAGNANPIKLLNPIASQMSVMRTSLLGSLMQVLKFNLDRKADRVRIFELGRVFLRDASVANTDGKTPKKASVTDWPNGVSRW